LWFPCFRYVAQGNQVVNQEESVMGLGSGTFVEFLRGGLTKLRSMRGAARRSAEQSNNEFVKERRVALRELLRAAAAQKLLPWGTTRVADFDADHVPAPAAEYVDLDEDLEGDSEFNPIWTD
jgi:hypothetical protein